MNAAANIPPPDGWPPELRLLVAHLRLALGTGTAADHERSRQPADWTAWLRWVERHRVGSFLHHRLPAAARAGLPEPVAAELRTMAVLNVQRALARTGELLRLAAEWERAGRRVIAFKGPVLARQLYGEAGLRAAGDLDLLVAPADAAAASAALRGDGYRRTYPDFELTPLQWEKFLRLQHELNHHHAGRGITVELQWRLEELPPVAFDELWRARGSVNLAGQSLATLPAEISALHLFAHGARHGWASLFWLLDIALLLPAAGPGLWAVACRLRLTRPLLQGVTLAGQLFGVTPPDDLREPLARADADGPLLAEARRRISLPEVRQAGLGPVFRDTLYAFRLQETWRGRLGLIQPRLLSPQNWKRWPLPDRWFWLYYPASPVLWMWRRLRGRNSGE